MKKLLLLYLSVIPSILFGQIPALNWANSTDFTVQSSAIMPNGNIISGGSFSGTNDFDPGADSLKLTAAGSLDMCLQMLDANGNLVWAKGFGSAEQDVIKSIATDEDGNIFVTGYFKETVDFDLGPGVSNLTSAGQQDLFILKLDHLGDFEWVKQIESQYAVLGNSIKLGLNGELLLAGSFGGTVNFGTTTLTSNSSSSAGVTDFFVAKLNATGDVVWATSAGSPGTDDCNDVTVDAQGNVYCTGDFQGQNIDFDPSMAQGLLSAHLGDYDGFVMKLNAIGEYQWAFSIGGAGRDRTVSIEVDAQDKIYVSGQFDGTSDFDPLGSSTNLTSTLNDLFIQKLNSDGTLVWVKVISGAGTQQCRDMFVSEAGEVHVVGFAMGDTDFDPSSNSQLITSSTNDWYGHITKLDVNGDLDWYSVFEGASNFIQAINFDIDDNLILTGQQYGIVDVDPTANVNNLNVAPYSANGAMVIKFGSNSTSSVPEADWVNLTVFPNPTENRINVLSPFEIEQITIYNSLGQNIMSTTVSSIELNNLPAGIYFVKVKTAESEYTRKIVKK
ncbi:T9SS type A sorting domain-containing protein [Putridiphycobacter roseus]|nr:T9SS type A sorting domain-containing protein [Putridiphycobacter roseus]